MHRMGLAIPFAVIVTTLLIGRWRNAALLQQQHQESEATGPLAERL